MAKEAAVRAGIGYAQALFEFGYDQDYPNLERGEVFKLAGHMNDQKLIDMKYCVQIKKGTELQECGVCGKQFIDEQTRRVHGDIWHQGRCIDCGMSLEQYKDQVAALRHHRPRCPLGIAREQRATERKQHFDIVKELATAGM